ncbi:glycosyltransferase family 4 protein [Methanothermobacter tenebrarum]|uniref:Glycosyltransferase family 1 protein n=1 Tax=Methanothermobacter tenebrarum TaxID=680118 RepID=A0A328PCA2_9EURY|nr:glycosyltransferase family 4 protein [Methanothermobacter tenebrarum]NPV64434.1 glycosyltransferase family 4 protein [Methanobacteriaceae archaeon]RAO78791.1 glycosyltransferase family 1 protein [Methanothermobacter tenebrarum]
MKILMISPYFYPEGGGAEFYMYQIAKKLSKEHEITILCTTKDLSNPPNIDSDFNIGVLGHHFKISTTPISLTALRDMVSFIKKNDFDLCNINYYLPYFPDMAALACKICKLPSVLTWHNDIYGTGLLRIMSTLYNYTLNKITLNIVDKIVTPSPYCYRESPILTRFKEKVVWVPPGVDLEKYKKTPNIPIHEKYGIPPDYKIILFVGVMDKSTTHKGVKTLIEAFKRLNFDKTCLIMVGKGNMIPQYRKYCQKLNIANKVIFTGFIKEEILINLYRNSELLVLPSTTIQEGFGMVLIEANACGKPVIGSKIGGIKYVIRDGETGLLVPPGDPNALANAMERLLEDERLAKKMGSKGRKMVQKNYTWDRVAKITEKVFERVVYGSS